MHDLQKMMDGELASLQSAIKAEQARRSAEKMIPVFGVKTSPINQYEFADPAQAISCAAGLLDKVLDEFGMTFPKVDYRGGTVICCVSTFSM
ncbi:hypothetical protein [Enterobacter hormaechei]|uniref:hypothetical protein n=1 Tax=Enterobacter hormaechei TaxID=158836 RepID=UPI00388E3C9D